MHNVEIDFSWLFLDFLALFPLVPSPGTMGLLILFTEWRKEWVVAGVWGGEEVDYHASDIVHKPTEQLILTYRNRAAHNHQKRHASLHRMDCFSRYLFALRVQCLQSSSVSPRTTCFCVHLHYSTRSSMAGSRECRNTELQRCVCKGSYLHMQSGVTCECDREICMTKSLESANTTIVCNPLYWTSKNRSLQTSHTPRPSTPSVFIPYRMQQQSTK